MSKAAHTSGPWHVEDYMGADAPAWHVLPPDYKGTIASLTGPKAEANARLIAAAPDLLAALKFAQLWLDVDGRFDMQGINAAIAKAEGRT